MQHYFVFLSFEVLASMNYDRDFIHDELEELGGHLKTEHGFVINPLRTVFYGVCTDCISKKQNEDTNEE